MPRQKQTDHQINKKFALWNTKSCPGPVEKNYDNGNVFQLQKNSSIGFKPDDSYRISVPQNDMVTVASSSQRLQSSAKNLSTHVQNFESSSKNCVTSVTQQDDTSYASLITNNTNLVKPGDVAESAENKLVKSKSKFQGRHICPYCGHGCAKPSVLEKHLRAHTNERPFPCVPCGFAFKTKSNLYKHCKSRAHVMNVSNASRATVIADGSTDSMSSSSFTFSDEEFSESSYEGTKAAKTEYSNTNCSESSRNQLVNVSTPQVESSLSSNYSLLHKHVDDVQMPSSIYGTKALNLMDSTLTGFTKLDFCNYSKENDESSEKSNNNIPVNFFEGSNRISTQLLTASDSSETVISAQCNTSISNEDVKTCKSSLKVKGAGLKLEIPAPDLANISSTLNSAGSSGSASSSRSIKSPKVTSPAQLELHISKIISENAAIVETFDSLWPRRYLRQSSIGTSQNVDAELKKSEQSRAASIKGRRFSDNISWSSCTSTPITSSSSVPGMLKKSASHGEEGENDTDDCHGFMKSYCQAKDECETPEGEKKLSSDNPEGSIIKDLLLKVCNSSSKDLVVSTDSNSNYLIAPVTASASGVSSSCSTAASSNSAFYLCSNCNVSFRKRKNLEIHQLHYCKKSEIFNKQNSKNLNINTELGDDASSASQCSPMQLTTDYGSVSLVGDMPVVSEDEKISEETSSLCNSNIFLKSGAPQHLSSNIKKRKFSDTNLLHHAKADPHRRISFAGVTNDEALKIQKSLPKRQYSLQLFGGQVEINDCTEPKKVKVDTNNALHSASLEHRLPTPQMSLPKSSVFPWLSSKDSSLPSSTEEPSSPFMVTIAKPVLNSGGTVLQVSSSSETSRKKSICIPVVAVGGPLVSSRLSSNIGSSSLNRIEKYDAVVLSSSTPISGQETFKLNNYNSSLLKEFDSDTDIKSLKSPSSPVCPFPSAASNLSSNPIEPSFVLTYNRQNNEKSEAANKNSFADDTVDKNWLGKVPILMVTPDSPRSSPVNMNLTNSQPAEISQNFLAPKRPTSLPLKKKAVTMKLIGTTLVSPETPRPKKRYGQLHLNGHAYTYLGLKRSTKSTWCCIYRPQPMYVPQDTNNKLSMYSNWQVVATEPEFHGLLPGKAMALYDSYHLKRKDQMCMSKHDVSCIVTHSSYWMYRNEKDKINEESNSPAPVSKPGEVTPKQNQSDLLVALQSPQPEKTSPSKSPRKSPVAGMSIEIPNDKKSSEKQEVLEASKCEDASIYSHKSGSKRIRIFEGGFKSNEDYTYVRGRGRGKYVCEECGIRCKKPSMLKKHIRTHTDLRPYTCKHCSFSFKTKGNLTKHMKSKAHHKKCVELGIIPVPTLIDNSQIDAVALAKQEELDRHRGKFEDDDDDTEDEDDDDDEDEDDDESDIEKYVGNAAGNNFEDGHQAALQSELKIHSPSVSKEQEVAKSLLNLSNMIVPAIHDSSKIMSKPPTPQRSLSLSYSGAHAVNNKSKTPLTLTSKSVPCQVIHTHHATMMKVHEEMVCHQTVHPESVSNPAVRTPLTNEKDLNESFENKQKNLLQIASLATKSSPRSPRNSNYNKCDNLKSTQEYDTAAKIMINSPTIFSKGSGSGTKLTETVVMPRRRSISETREESYIDPDKNQQYSRNKHRKYSFSYPEPLHVITDSQFGYKHQVVGHPSLKDPNKITGELEKNDQPIDLSISRSNIDAEPVKDHKTLVHSLMKHAIASQNETSLANSASVTISLNAVANRPVVNMASMSNTSPVQPLKQMTLSSSKQSLAIPTTEVLPSSSNNAASQYSLHKSNIGNAASIASQYQEITAPSKKSSLPSKKRLTSVLSESSIAVSTKHQNLVLNSDKSSPSSSAENVLSEKEKKLTMLRKEMTSPSNDDQHDDDGAPLPSFSAMTSYTNSLGEEGKCMCQICHKLFSKPSQLRLHVNIHYIERPFRCESCAISFRTKGHLEKHKRSLSHYNKVNMNMTFGIPTTENPRPFKCSDCKIAFRIHGHLAKHLRSKLHIMKLECLGKLPFGTYAEIERSGTNLNEIDTSDCDNSLESLQLMAQKIYGKELPTVGTSGDEVDLPEPSSPKEPTEDNSDIIIEHLDGISSYSNVHIKNEIGEAGMDYSVNSDSDGSELDVTTPEPWSCSQCQIIFKSAKLLEVHMSDVHRSEQDLANHVNVNHTKVITCSLCRKTCNSDQEFQQHLLTHAQPRPFVCEICDAGFITMPHLNYHMTSYHQTIICQSCGFGFSNTNALHQHIQEAHVNRNS